MNKKILIISFLTIALIASCKHKTVSGHPPFLSVESTELSFYAEENSKLIWCITGNTKITDVSSSQPSWCTASVKVADSNTQIEVHVTKNPDTDKERAATITVAAEKMESVSIEVTQMANLYDRSAIYLTWLNVWDGSTESWWSSVSSSGVKITYDGISTTTKSLDWNDPALRPFYLQQVKEAGINVIVLDLTNGLRWPDPCNTIRDFAATNNMKYAAAINIANMNDFETKAKTVWDVYANPDVMHGDAYFYKDGKPLMVMYVAANVWDDMLQKGNIPPSFEYGSKFTLVWASGEDSRKDKWGWQIPAYAGPQPSSEAMFVTSSLNWTAPHWSMTGWRKNLAYLDYNFLVARQYAPKYIIVNSYDDIRERHGWMVAETADASLNYNALVANTSDNEGTPGLIMRDVYGNISTDAYYNRTVDWIKNGMASVYHIGGIIPDGAYLMTNASTGNGVSSENPSGYNPQNGILPVDRTNDKTGVPLVQMENPGYQQYLFFYHLGNDEYRMVRICIGLSLEDCSGKVCVQYDSPDDSQRWKVTKDGERYTLTNKATGRVMTADDSTENIISAPAEAGNMHQRWTLTPILTM